MALQNLFGDLNLEATQTQVLDRLSNPLKIRGRDGIEISSKENPLPVQQVGSKINFGSLSIPPNATDTINIFVTTGYTIIKKVFVSGDGDAEISIFVNGNKQLQSRISVICPNFTLPCDFSVAAGSTVEVDIKCIGTETSNYNSTIFYEE